MTLLLSDEGAATFSYIFGNYRNPPFLRRNVRQVLPSITTMGTAFSSRKAATRCSEGDESFLPGDHGTEVDEGERPMKRMRTEPQGHQEAQTIRRPFGQMTNESRSSLKAVSNTGTIEPVNFYGKTNPRLLQRATPQTRYGSRMKNLIPKAPVDFYGALKIDFLGIHCSGGTEADKSILSKLRRTPGNSIDIKCKCAVSIFCATGETFELKCRHVKRYTLRLSIDHDGDVDREFITPSGSPFIFSSKDLYVTREIHRRPGSDRALRTVNGLEPVPDLADDYRIQILVESDGYNKHWPPFDMPPCENPHDGSNTKPRPISRLLGDNLVKEWQLSLYCTASKILEPGRQERPARLALYYEEEKQPVDYFLELDIRWSQANTLGSHKTEVPKIEPTLPVAALHKQSVSISPLKRKADEMSMPDSPATRSQRNRATVATYNLKALSAQAQGRSPRKQQQQQLQHPDGDMSVASENANNLIVLYSFGKADAADAGIRTSNEVPGLSCPFCHCPNRTLDQLRLHLCNEHTNFKFSLRRKDPPRITFFVEVLKNRSAHKDDTQQTFQLTKSNTLFDLEKYLNGDNSWVKKREGPQDDVYTENNINPVILSRPSSTCDSRQSSPHTSEALEDITFHEPCKAASPLRCNARPHKKIKVPRTTRLLYHTISKKPLVPGQDLSSSEDEKDETWYYQKHRDIINDFSDVNLDEMEFINRWNPFITKKQQSVRNFLHRAIAEFAEENKRWLQEKSSRRREFILHCQACILRGDLSEDQFVACLDMLDVNKRDLPSSMDLDIDVEQPAKARGEFDCACGKLASVAHDLTCRGKSSNNCPGRFYHRECAEKSGRNTRRKWLCDHCFALK